MLLWTCLCPSPQHQDDDDDEFKFNDASTHKGHLRLNGEKTVNNQPVYISTKNNKRARVCVCVCVGVGAVVVQIFHLFLHRMLAISWCIWAFQCHTWSWYCLGSWVSLGAAWMLASPSRDRSQCQLLGSFLFWLCWCLFGSVFWSGSIMLWCSPSGLCQVHRLDGLCDAKMLFSTRFLVDGKLQKLKASVTGDLIPAWSSCTTTVYLSILSNLGIPVTLYNEHILFRDLVDEFLKLLVELINSFISVSICWHIYLYYSDFEGRCS